MTRREVRQMLVSAALLAAFAVLGAALVSAIHGRTAERIEHNRRQALIRQLHAIIPPKSYDNDILADSREVRVPGTLGAARRVTVYRAYRDGKPVALALPAVADGYNGPIRLLVGIRYDGTVTGVRVISHQETPGLGDRIELSRSDWIRSFTGRSLGDPPAERWTVAEDGGAFDSFTGATITPRAVVKTVRRTLEYFARNRKRLFARDGRPPGNDGDGNG